MAAFNFFNAFFENVAEKVHDLGADAITVALTNTAPVATNTVLSNITEITYTNLSTRLLTRTSSAQSSGVYRAIFEDLVLTSTSGSTGPFRYVVVYNDTPTSPADPLIGWYDRGESITLADTDSLTVNLDNVEGLIKLQVAA